MSVMKLLQDGRVRLNDPVAAYLPEFAQNGKGDITVRELLTHYSGLAPDLDLKTSWQGRDAAFQMAMQQKPANPPGARFVYSDINFEALGFLVEKVSGMSLDEFAARNVFEPLGMSHTRFLPPEAWRSQIAPTQVDEHGQMLRGVVHDPTARRMGGVAGHAGLFSTADDLARLAQDLLSGSKVLTRASIEKMSTPQQPANAPILRGLGWDIDSPFASNRGELLPVGSFGHTGFTGTSLWIDPVTDTYIVLLTNAVHAPGGGSAVSLRSRVATAVVQSLALTVSEKEKLRLARITGYNETLMAARRLQVRNGAVKNGIDVLEEHQLRELHPDTAHPVRVGLVTNQTGVDAHGQRTVDVLARAPGIKLAAIFSPEHGIAGKVDTTEIANARDEATGAPIYSVYGATDAQRRPDAATIAGLDVLVFDIADAGVRFYTYESTLGYFLEAAAKAGKEIVVLDRPNPITGAFIQGPMRDAERESFVSYGEVPVRHGMTMGELARMFNAERGIGAKLTVVPMEGWMRGDWFRFDRRAVDESVAESAQSDTGDSLSRRGNDRDDERFRWPRDGYAVRGVWCAVDRARGSGAVSECARDRGNAVCSGALHSGDLPLCRAGVRRRESHAHRSRCAGCAGDGTGDCGSAARVVSGKVRCNAAGCAHGEQGERGCVFFRPGHAAHRGGMAGCSRDV